MDMPLVSFIVPMHNSENTIEDTLLSILKINYVNFEIIVINDNSSDSSEKIVSKLMSAHKQIKLISNNTDKHGPGIARNFGIKQVHGKYLAFVDSDDLVSSNILEETIPLMEKMDSDICFFNYCNRTKNDIQEKNIIKKELNGISLTKKEFRPLMLNMMHSPWGKVYRSSIILQNNVLFPDFLDAEDTLFVYKTFNYAKKFSFITKNLYFYTLDNNSSITNQKDKKKNISGLQAITESYLYLHKLLPRQKFFLDLDSFLISNWVYNVRFLSKKERVDSLIQLNNLLEKNGPPLPKIGLVYYILSYFFRFLPKSKLRDTLKKMYEINKKYRMILHVS